MRLIDADALGEIVQTGLRSNPHEDRRARAIHQAEYIHFLDIIRRAPTITTPPNDPLTLEELRKMDGEPVWISPAKENGKVPARWMLVSGYNLNKGIYLFAPSCNITQGYDGKSYGKTWVAYRRKPEKENRNAET